MQHVASAHLGHPNLRYHVYIVPIDFKLPHAIMFSHVGAFEVEEKLECMQ